MRPDVEWIGVKPRDQSEWERVIAEVLPRGRVLMRAMDRGHRVVHADDHPGTVRISEHVSSCEVLRGKLTAALKKARLPVVE
jgi:hypothetical protein